MVILSRLLFYNRRVLKYSLQYLRFFDNLKPIWRFWTVFINLCWNWISSFCFHVRVDYKKGIGEYDGHATDGRWRSFRVHVGIWNIGMSGCCKFLRKPIGCCGGDDCGWWWRVGHFSGTNVRLINYLSSFSWFSSFNRLFPEKRTWIKFKVLIYFHIFKFSKFNTIYFSTDNF